MRENEVGLQERVLFDTSRYAAGGSIKANSKVDVILCLAPVSNMTWPLSPPPTTKTENTAPLPPASPKLSAPSVNYIYTRAHLPLSYSTSFPCFFHWVNSLSPSPLSLTRRESEEHWTRSKTLFFFSFPTKSFTPFSPFQASQLLREIQELLLHKASSSFTFPLSLLYL